jgi:hypothetical protein
MFVNSSLIFITAVGLPNVAVPTDTAEAPAKN